MPSLTAIDQLPLSPQPLPLSQPPHPTPIDTWPGQEAEFCMAPSTFFWSVLGLVKVGAPAGNPSDKWAPSPNGLVWLGWGGAGGNSGLFSELQWGMPTTREGQWVL